MTEQNEVLGAAGAPGAPNQLRRTLGLWQVTISGVGIVIGAGIYVLIGSAAAEAGNAVWLSFVVAALMSGLTGLSYAELASMFPSASAEYEFARQAFNEFVGFIAGWVMLVAFVIAASAVSIGFGHYLGYFVDVDSRLAAAGLLIVLTLIVISGVQRSIWLSVVLVLLQVGGLVMVIAAGAPHVGQKDLLEGGSVTGVLGGAALMFFAFIGFDDIVTLSEETSDPHRTMPRALLLTLGISTLLYVLVGISAVSVVGGDALAASKTPLAEVLAHDWQGTGSDIIAFIALAATTNTTLLVLTAASRLVFGIAERGSLPPVLATVGRHGGAPYPAALVILAVTLGFAILSDIETVASVTDLTVYVVFVIVNLSAITLRYRLPNARRGFRSPGSIHGLAITPVLALLAVVTLMAFIHQQAWIIGFGSVSLGAIVWALFSLQRRRAGV